jgi:hypothetical protein
MTTGIHHREPLHLHMPHGMEWMWVGIAIVVVAIVVAGIAVPLIQSDDTAASLPGTVQGFEYTEEFTTAHMNAGAVTSAYVGLSGDLWVADTPVAGFEHHDATTGHLPVPGVTSPFVGESGELDPDR